jgi:hypothetical protein
MNSNSSSKFAKAKFIIYGMLAIIVSLSLPESIKIDFLSPTSFSLFFLMNVFNAIGAILIVGGIFEIILKDQFIQEVSKDFIKALFLERSSLGRFNQSDLIQMKTNIQEELLGKGNNHFKNKLMHMINNSFFQIARGTHANEDFNMFYDYYNVVIYIKGSSKRFIEIEYDLKYKLINNKVDEKRQLIDSVLTTVFAKRFFPSFKDDDVTQKVLSLVIKKDGQLYDYKEDIDKGLFVEQILNKGTEDDIKALKEDVKKQIQRKNDDESFSPLEVKFHDYLIVEKKILVKTLYTDFNYSHIFKRPTLNYSIHFIDENVDVSLEEVDYLSLRLFSGLNKKNNDKIHPVLKGNSISLTVSDELLLAGEGISINSIRKDWNIARA